jgi:UDP:flavonoid glycosyltransferase YjiC (YdhE family)
MNDGSAAGPIGPISKRRRILFVAEAVTLAHAARPVVLAQALDSKLYEVHLACDPRYNALFPNLALIRRSIRTISSKQFLSTLARGSPVYDVDTLRAYVKEDLELIKAVRPDLIVGDFRLSLAVSAPLTGIPYMAISNAYWSPYARQTFPVPDIPLTRIVGVKLAQALFNAIRPLIFAYHTRPLNRVRQEYGLPSLGFDLCRIYTYADYVLYADIPELIPTFNLPANHYYLGPLLWSPAVKFPDWEGDVPRNRPVIYMTLGSSGRSELLPVVLKALADLPVTVMAATAGRVEPNNIPANIFVADYLPGKEAIASASLVICNGGSPTTQQALSAGIPVLGIASNMDQHLNMEAIQRAGAGRLLRAGNAKAHTIRAIVTHMLIDTTYTEAAVKLSHALANYHAQSKFLNIVSLEFRHD